MHDKVQQQFEATKNKKAFLYTAIVLAVFLLFSVLYTWSLAAPRPEDDMDLIEINLGNEQEGMGDIQPLVPGDMAPDDQSITAAESGNRVNEEPQNSIQATEDPNSDAPAVAKVNTTTSDNKSNRPTPEKTTKAVNPSNVHNPNPTPPRPKALYKGGTGQGGNNADQDNGYRNQGYTGTTGDMGSPDGNPDSYGNSKGGRTGVSISKGLQGRRVVSFPSMRDDFNQNAKVYVDVVVNASGKVISANVGRGTTTSNTSMRNIAITKAKGLKFNANSDGKNQTGTLLFNFVLEN